MSHDYAIQKLSQQLAVLNAQVKALEDQLVAARTETAGVQMELLKVEEELEQKMNRGEFDFDRILDLFAVQQDASREAIKSWVRAYVRDQLELRDGQTVGKL